MEMLAALRACSKHAAACKGAPLHCTQRGGTAACDAVLLAAMLARRFVFPRQLPIWPAGFNYGPTPRLVWHAISHETGHSLGL